MTINPCLALVRSIKLVVVAVIALLSGCQSEAAPPINAVGQWIDAGKFITIDCLPRGNRNLTETSIVKTDGIAFPTYGYGGGGKVGGWAKVSADGRWLAVESLEPGKYFIYRRS